MELSAAKVIKRTIPCKQKGMKKPHGCKFRGATETKYEFRFSFPYTVAKTKESLMAAKEK